MLAKFSVPITEAKFSQVVKFGVCRMVTLISEKKATTLESATRGRLNSHSDSAIHDRPDNLLVGVDLGSEKVRMLIQWCLKGISERSTFGDTEAEALLYSGIKSNWLFNNPTMPIEQAIPTVQNMLGMSALLTHVNNYAAVRTTSPYISLSAGVVLRDTALGSRKFPAWRSAVDFATEWGRTTGYVYRVWTIVAPQPSPRVMNVSDEIRNLNLFDAAGKYQTQGEITAKLVIPPAQIEYVVKVGSDRRRTGFRKDNAGFVKPESISNLVVEI